MVSVALKLLNEKSCFLCVNDALIKLLKLKDESLIILLSPEIEKQLYLSVKRDNQVEPGSVGLGAMFARTNGLKDGAQVIIYSEWSAIPECSKVTIAPLDENEFEVFVARKQELAINFRSQISIVSAGMFVPFWIGHQCHMAKIKETTPDAVCARLSYNSELEISGPLRHRSAQNKSRVVQTKPGATRTTIVPSQNVIRHDIKHLTYKKASGMFASAEKQVNMTYTGEIRKEPFSYHARVQAAPAHTDITTIFMRQDMLNLKQEDIVPESFIAKIYNTSGADEDRKRANDDQSSNISMTWMTVRVKVKRNNCDTAPMSGHVLMGEATRRQLRAAVMSQLLIKQLDSQHVQPVCIKSLRIIPTTNPAKSVADYVKLLQIYLANYSPSCPLVVNKYTAIEYAYKVSFVLLCDAIQDGGYGLLYGDMLQEIDCQMANQKTTPPPAALLADASNVNPSFQTDVTINTLGGVKKIFDCTVDHLKFTLGFSSGRDEKHQSRDISVSPGHMLLTGPTGVGKTSLANAVCQHMADLPNYVHVQSLSCKTMRGQPLEKIQGKLQDTMNSAELHAPALVMLDDLDHLTFHVCNEGSQSQESQDGMYATRLAEIVKELLLGERRLHTRVVVLATARSKSSLHDTLVAPSGHHLIHKVMDIKIPNQAERVEILQKTIKRHKARPSDRPLTDSELRDICNLLQGYVACDLSTVVKRAIVEFYTQNKHAKVSCVECEHLKAALKDYKPVSLHDVNLHSPGEHTWADIGGLNDVRTLLEQTMSWPSKYPELYSKCPLRLRSGILLYGAPGTGKTLLASVVAKEFGLNFITIKGPELLNKYIGASEQAVRDVFEKAQNAKPCILFFDEFDALAPTRGHDSTGVTDRVVNQLLTQLDGVEGLDGVYMLAASSRPDTIDPALLRPGRLDKSVYCKLPEQGDRLEILRALTRHMTLAKDVDLAEIANHTAYYSGADLKSLVCEAQLAVINEKLDQKSKNQQQNADDKAVKKQKVVIPVHQSHLKAALDQTKPSLSKQQREECDVRFARFTNSDKNSGIDLKNMKQRTTHM